MKSAVFCEIEKKEEKSVNECFPCWTHLVWKYFLGVIKGWFGSSGGGGERVELNFACPPRLVTLTVSSEVGESRNIFLFSVVSLTKSDLS